MATRKPVAKAKKLRRPAETDLGFRWGRANSLLLGSGLLALALGYVTLARGSMTLAPTLLVAGYCGFIPAALLLRGRTTEESGE